MKKVMILGFVFILSVAQAKDSNRDVRAAENDSRSARAFLISDGNFLETIRYEVADNGRCLENRTINGAKASNEFRAQSVVKEVKEELCKSQKVIDYLNQNLSENTPIKSIPIAFDHSVSNSDGPSKRTCAETLQVTKNSVDTGAVRYYIYRLPTKAQCLSLFEDPSDQKVVQDAFALIGE